MEETPARGDPCFEKTKNLLVGSNTIAAEAAVRALEEIGLNTHLITTTQEGEAKEVGKLAARLARQVREGKGPAAPPAALVLGGETTVKVVGQGKGGRNQELALAAAMEIQGLGDVTVVSFATDGQDGPTEAAGAVATGDTLKRASEKGMDPKEHLTRNDSHGFFEKLGDLLITGPTGTNVADLVFIFVEQCSS